MEHEQQLRDHLVNMMRGGQAFRPMEELLDGLTAKEAGSRVEQLPYTIWQLLEHLRFAQRDILAFCKDQDYKEPQWPDDYWTDTTAPANETALQNTLNAIQQDLEEMVKLVQDMGNDLFKPLPNGNGQTLLREATLIAEHNAYHIGEIVVIRRLLGHI